MSTISLCMIVKNEAAVLARCLDSVADLVDEIVIVDTGSTDQTREIAARYTSRIYTFPWIDDFAAARNAAFDYAVMDYCMWLDADDVLLEEDRAAFRTVRQTLLPDADVVMMPYHAAVDEAGRPTLTYYRERIVRRSPIYRWKGAVHESIVPSGTIVYADAAVTHRKEGGDPDRNLRILEGIAAQRPLEPREAFYYGRELSGHGRWEDAVRVLEAFLDQGAGWVENNIDACQVLSCCYTALGRDREALRALLESFSYDAPRAETCCELGRIFLDKKAYRQAAYWYERALSCPQNDTSGAFVRPDCYGYLPAIQLCVCWYWLGDLAQAAAWNERAGEYKPEDPSYQYNKAFFAGIAE